jgi:hypothetical protein
MGDAIGIEKTSGRNPVFTNKDHRPAICMNAAASRLLNLEETQNTESPFAMNSATRYEIPIVDFEEMIGDGLWVGHRFVCNGQNLILTAIGQAQTTDDGERVVPVEVGWDSSVDCAKGAANLRIERSASCFSFDAVDMKSDVEDTAWCYFCWHFGTGLGRG